MTPEERAQRLLSRLPILLQAGPNIRRIFEAMGNELMDMEKSTRLLLESRWYKLARGFDVDAPLATKASSDLAAIGALFDLVPGRGENTEYFRRHISELIRIHFRGLSTARSILQLVAFVYLAEGSPLIDVQNGLSVGKFQVRDENGELREIRVELVDNPPREAQARFSSVEAERHVIVENMGLEDAFPNIQIRAVTGDLVVPLLHQEESGLDVIFLGTVAKGQTLSLRHGQPPIIDGYPTDGAVLLANPTRFAATEVDDHLFRFDTADARFSICEVTYALPSLLLGETRWTYRPMPRAELRAYLASLPELSNYVDRAQEDPEAPRVDIYFQWTEITPAACELRIPAGYVPPHYQDASGVIDSIGFYRDVDAALEYGRAAGIRATVGLTLPLESEKVIMVESPMRMTVDMAFVEEQTTADELTTVGPMIDMQETLDEPTDFLTFGGIFNTTYFDTSRFQ